MAASKLIQSDPWRELRTRTPARVGLGRVGQSLPTAEWLAFSAAHAQARDAVHLPLDLAALTHDIEQLGLATLKVTSAARDRATYLLRPDLGRRLSADSAADLAQARQANHFATELQIVVADGLSSMAVARQAPGVLACLQAAWPDTWVWSPVVIATQARVALGDDIGQRLGSRLVAVLIGERPGLSSPDSLGIYLTHAPQRGCTDAQRNCLSNVRPEGLSHAEAARKLLWLAKEAHRRQLTGVQLKDLSDMRTLGDAVDMRQLSVDSADSSTPTAT